MLEFDKINEWAPGLAAALEDVVPTSNREKLARVNLEYIEDACDALFSISDREAIIDRTISWLESSTVVGFHGTRLTEAEVISVQSLGLLRLTAERRRLRLERALSRHPRWPEVAPRLDALISAYGAGARAGRREGQAHLTLSRSGLIESFNHYISFGAEFNQHVAYDLLEGDGERLLAADGLPRLVVMAIPGRAALAAAHPYFNIADIRERGEIPNIVRQFITAWAYIVACPTNSLGRYHVDCGLVFKTDISPAWLLRVETLDNAQK